MAITILQERKKQRYTALALAAIIFTILLIVWLGFSKKQEEASPASAPAVYAIPKIGIDRQLLDILRAKNFGVFEEIVPFEKEFGRKNPFIPFKKI